MAVYERTWRRYDGPVTRLSRRPLVITRFALADVFGSRAFTGFYVLSFLPSLVGLALVYLSHNAGLIQSLGLDVELVDAVTMAFFRILFVWQAVPAFVVAVIVAPGLIAPDLSDNALPLYLGRPVSRAGYVLGKMGVLAVLLSPVTWIAGLSVFGLQAVLEGGGWGWQHRFIGLAYLLGHLVWMVVISLLTLAISTLVRHKTAARGALFGIVFVLGAFAELVSAVTGSALGQLLDPVESIVHVVLHLFDAAAPGAPPVAGSWLTLVAVSVLSVWILARKLRPHEVVS